MKSLLLLLMMASCSSAFARLGENFDQSKARYGAPEVSDTAPGCMEAKFKSGQFEIVAHFYQNKCVEISFEKFDAQAGSVTKFTTSMTKEEAQEIVDQNQEGQHWDDPEIKQSDDGIMYIWKRDDGARAYRTAIRLMIQNSDSEKYDSATSEKEHADKMNAAKKSTSGL